MVMTLFLVLHFDFSCDSLSRMHPFTQFSIRYTADNELQIIDQILLPDEERWITARNHNDMYDFIKRLSTRGAPMIGVAAVSRAPSCLSPLPRNMEVLNQSLVF